jgi:pimeloyl-ACP methyl ester carboxylesterase
MPYTTHQGVRIHYQVEGDGPPLVIQHGFTDSMTTWYEVGYVTALKDTFQLILVDARGHGHSEKPHAPEAYGTEVMVGDVVAVLDAVHVPKAHFIGYSMGGWIGYGMAKYALERLHSLSIGGHTPIRDLQSPIISDSKGCSRERTSSQRCGMHLCHLRCTRGCSRMTLRPAWP